MMFWNDDVVAKVDALLAERCKVLAINFSAAVIAGLTLTQGHIRPPIFSEAGEYPFMQTHGLANSIKVSQNSPLSYTVYSDAVDVNTGKHYSSLVEHGYYWDGWAIDWEHGNKPKKFSAHWVEQRPFMRLTVAAYTKDRIENEFIGSAT